VALRRIRILFRARLDAGPKGGLPAATLLGQAFLTSVLCGLVGDALPPFAFGVFALSWTAALLALPLLGELGSLLRADEAGEWAAALPVAPHELRISRALYLLTCLYALALASLVPAAFFAPESTDLLSRCLLPLCGLGLATLIAALLLAVQSFLGGRAEGLLIGVQTILVVGVIVGLVAGLGRVPELARLPTLGDETAGFLWAYPPAWFAAPMASAEGEPSRLWLPLGAWILSLAGLLLLPEPRTVPRARREPWLAFLLRPARTVATRLWCRKDERGPFDLVYDALPRERDVVLRTYPMVGIPIAFLLVALGGESDSASRRDFLCVLLFTAPIYLPVLLTHVPASASHAARWILEGAPVPEGAVVAGTLKAVAVRFVLPLYLALGLIAWIQAGPTFALSFTPIGFLVSILVLRSLHRVCVDEPPLSIPTDRVKTDLDWISLLAGQALALTLAAVLASRFLTGIQPWIVIAGLVAVELIVERVARSTRTAPAAGAP